MEPYYYNENVIDQDITNQDNLIIVSRLSNEIKTFFKILKQDTINSGEIKQNILKYSSIIHKFICDIHKDTKDVEEAKECLTKIIYNIKLSISDLCSHKSNNIIESDISLDLFIKYVDRSNKEIQIINIVFGHIYKENIKLDTSFYRNANSNKNTIFNQIKEIYNNTFIEIVLIKNINIILELFNNYINEIRTHLNSNYKYYNLSDYSNNNYNIKGKLTSSLNEKFYILSKTLTIFTELDFITKNKFKCNEMLFKYYIESLSNIYIIYSNVLSVIDNTNISHKINEIMKIFAIETFIDDSIFNGCKKFKNILDMEVLSSNIGCINTYFKEKIQVLPEKFDDIISTIKSGEFNTNNFFNEILDIPNFLIIYHNMYNYNCESVRIIYTMLGNEIINIFKNILSKTNEKVNIEYIMHSYMFLLKLENEIMGKITPTNEFEVDKQNDIELKSLKFEYDKLVINDLEITNNIHKCMSDILSDTNHNELCEILLSLSLKNNDKKTSKLKSSEKSDNNKSKNLDIIEFTSKFKDNNDDEHIIEIIKYIIYCTKNKDELEEYFKKLMIKKIIQTDLKNIDIEHLTDMIIDISELPNFCISINRSILKSYTNGKLLSNEYNILYPSIKEQFFNGIEETILDMDMNTKSNENRNTGHDKNKSHINSQNSDIDFLNLKSLPDGIINLSSSEYSYETYKSPTFREYIKVLKESFNNYFTCKYESRVNKWCENLSTLELDYSVKSCNLKLCVNYKQADNLFLYQYEYDSAINELKTENSKNKILDTTYELLAYNDLFKILNESSLMKYLIEKNIFKLEEITLNNNKKIQIINFNNNIKIKRDKKLDLFKLKFKDDIKDAKSKLKSESDNKSRDSSYILVLYRSDYIQSYIMKYCKANKERFISENELYDKTYNYIKTRFEVETPLFKTSLKKLVENEYLDIDTTTQNEHSYKYIS